MTILNLSNHSNNRLLMALLAAFPVFSAQAAGEVAPGAGTILQQVQPVAPMAPSSSGTGLTTHQPEYGEMPESAPFLVLTLSIAGNTQFDANTLHALVADAENQAMTLGQLQEVVSRITKYYQDQGYPLTRAYIPSQEIHEGQVRIEVIEARYGTIRLENSSGMGNSLLESTISPLQSEQEIEQSNLNRTLLLLSDIPGVSVGAVLKPGEAVGHADLQVDVSPTSMVAGSVTLDNYGNRYTGRARLGGEVDIVNPLRHGDVLSAYVLSSGGDMNYGRIAYESLLNGLGTRLGGSWSALHYRLGDFLDKLDAHGTATVGSLWARHPWVRSQNFNLYGRLQYDHMNLRDHIDTSATQTDRHLDEWTVSVAGDSRDMLLAGGTNLWYASWSGGHVGFDDQAAQLADAGTAQTQGGYSKWNLNLSRQQQLDAQDELYLSFSGQKANGNLDSSMKMTVGGPHSVRAYDVGAISGDSGYLGTLELRHLLGRWYGQWQVTGFVDVAHVTVNESPWVAGSNDATLSGVGMALDWSADGPWHATAYLAKATGNKPTLLESRDSVRAWMEVGWVF